MQMDGNMHSNRDSAWSEITIPEKAHIISPPASLEDGTQPRKQISASTSWTKLVRSAYRWLFSLIFLLNAIGLLVFFLCAPRPYPKEHLATAITANLAIAILARQDYVFNSLYKLARATPHWVPLAVRYKLVRVYEYGGIHSGSAACAVIWFIIFTGFLTIDAFSTGAAILTLNYLVLLLLVFIMVTAYPSLRFIHHNNFEFMHRFGGWSVLGIFWIELILFIRSDGDLATGVITSPSFWMLLIMSLHIILPWLRLRRIDCEPEVLSDHALRLHHKIEMPLYRGLAIAEHPLSEWHSFASIPNRDGKGGSLLISNAGDWTKKTIREPRQHYYVKGLPRTGVLALLKMFKSALVVTTGSGIGPVLGIAMDVPHTKLKLLWSTRSPEKVYGKGIIDLVKLVDPEPNIIDTAIHKGRPDLVGISEEMARSIDAEAVFVISNRKLTMRIIHGLRDRGLHAYGPNWDS